MANVLYTRMNDGSAVKVVVINHYEETAQNLNCLCEMHIAGEWIQVNWTTTRLLTKREAVETGLITL